MFREYFKIFCCLFSKALKQMLLLDRETGALCAMKEVELFPDDPKSAECIKQLEQVGCPLLAFYHYLIGSCVRCTNCVECCVSCFFFVITVHIIFVNRTLCVCVCVCGFWRVPEAMPLKLVFASSWPLPQPITKQNLL